MVCVAFFAISSIEQRSIAAKRYSINVVVAVVDNSSMGSFVKATTKNSRQSPMPRIS